MPLQTNQVLFNKYRIEQLIGEGGFGYVYKATDLNLNRRVAIKELKAEFASNEEVLGRFISEARAVANLNDPHIVQVLDYHKEDACHLIVLEYMDGGSLAGLLSKRGSLLPGEAALIAKAIVDGLAAVHRQNIVHRDLKPANILLARNGQTVKISDFGIAHVPQSVSGIGNLTRVGTAMGTVWYMAPEQARGERVDGRSDIYSLGTMLYEMVAGYMYLNFSSDFLRDLDTLRTTPPRPLPPSVPEGLQRIISKAIAIDPAERYQTAEALAADLQAFVTPGATIAVPTTDPGRRRVPTPPPQPKPRSAAPLIAVGAVVGVVVLCLLAFAAYKIFSDQPTARPTVPQPAAIVAVPQSTIAPVSDRTAVAQEIFATQTAIARTNQLADNIVATRVAAGLTAAAPTFTPTSPAGTRVAPTVTLTPVPTIPPGSPRKRLEPAGTLGEAYGINVVDIATGVRTLVYGQPNIPSAAWSPDGTQVLLSSDRGGQRVLLMLNPATRQFKDVRIEESRVRDLGSQEALWSPDGKQIFLHTVVVDHSTAALTLLSLDGTIQKISDRRLDKEGIPLYWSVDGKWIITVAAMNTPRPGDLVYEVYAEEVASLSDARRMKIPEWQQFQKSIGASDLVYDQRYWPWKARSAPVTCPSRKFFAECP